MLSLPIFLVGCPRSGTTLLRDLLRSHPRITFPLESHFIPLFHEALVAEPEAILRQVCAFLGEEFHPTMLAPNRVASGQWVSASSIVANNTHKWRSDMTEVDRILFESVAGDLLIELGYPVEGRTRSISNPEALFWQLHDQTLRIKEVLRQPQRWAIIPSVLPLFLSRLRVALQTKRQ